LPPYEAAIECVPTDRVDMANVALCVVVFRVPVPMVTPLLLKVTVPLMVPPEVEATVAVNVTEVPWVAGFEDETSVVVVDALFTVCVITGDELVASLVSPP
jgi:hypothetical protein